MNSTDFYKDGLVVRWNSNDRVPPKECLDRFLAEKLITEQEHKTSYQTEREEIAKEIEEYKKSMEGYEYSAEELFEMRAAFGSGATVVNVFTGKRTKL